MKTPSTITEFMFHVAHYHVSDGGSDAVTLQVNYAQNTYVVVGDTHAVPNVVFRREIRKLAASLLQRKHGVNFAERVASMV